MNPIANKEDQALGWTFQRRNGAASVEAFTASIDVDARLYRHDIRGSIAHAKMLAKQRIISGQRCAENRPGPAIGGARDRQRQVQVLSQADEDIHMNIERRLTELIGPAGGKLHTARSRNDQVALDMRLYLREEVKNDHRRACKNSNVSLAGRRKNIST